jgi:hypothetical protein
MIKTALISCEESQEVCKSFRELGIEAYSCDLLDCSGGYPQWHIKADVRLVIQKRLFDLYICFPPCTRLANSGVRWLAERGLWNELDEAIEFFNYFVQLGKSGKKVMIENPIQHKYARAKIEKYHQIIQPWQFGHGETKATCLWLYNLPKLQPTNIVPGREQKVWKMTPGPERSKWRSKTYPGIAAAMAIQWSKLL